MAPESKPVISVQVREFVEFALRTGDLGGGGDFVGSDRALAGTRGHQQIQRSRPAGYQKEVRLSYDLASEDFVLRIQGRIDGVTDGSPVLIEEIKTVQGRWEGVADALHWAQVKVYGYIYSHQHALDQVNLQLTYLNLDTGKLTEFLTLISTPELAQFFQHAAAIYEGWIREQVLWRRQRDQSISVLDFPFRRYRAGQRELAVAVYRAITREERLFLEAPTGIGKTMSVIFPAIKAMGQGKLERIFYLTARTTTRTVAEKALNELREAGLRLRTLTLTAKEKLCVQDGHPCDPQTCPLARGYYDRRLAAMRAALAREQLTRPVVEAIANEHRVCPFELSLDLSSWIDAVVCDYNYVFDPQVYLRRHFADDTGEYVFLVDEAHNLVDRAREMFSAEITRQEIDRVRRTLKQPLPGCAKALGKVSTAIKALCSRGVLEGSGGEEPLPALSARTDTNTPLGGDGVRRERPADLIRWVEKALHELEVWLARNEPAEFRLDLLELYFRLYTFQRTAERYDERYRTIIEPDGSSCVRLFCLDPSTLLGQALARGKAAVLFSATLTPLEYYRELLGGVPENPTLQLASPFPPENLAVLVHDRIRTQFKDRAGTLQDVTESIAAFVKERRGNYLVYLPSYQYLAGLEAMFRQLYPSVTVLTQRPGMSDAQRDQFLEAFAADGAETQVGFAVMGGIFGEGIDLMGDRLIGAVVVGVGLPQLCIERDLIRAYFEEKIGLGFDYAYTFPGMNRVLQAIGRVIRSETDRGAVLLIDTRFGERRYGRLFRAWWQPRRVRTAAQIGEALRLFWQGECRGDD